MRRGTFLRRSTAKPFAADGLRNWFRDRCNDVRGAGQFQRWQEWRDSNPQPPVLETGALAN
jgi:hypothetical protein